MARLRRLLLRLVHAVRPSHAEAEVQRELAAHLALLEDDFQRKGMTPSDARTAARKTLGGADQIRLAHRDARAFRWMDELRVDLRDALRTLVRHRRSTAIAVLVLTMAGAVNAVTLGVADAVLFRSLPYRDPSSIRVLQMRSAKTGQRYTRVPENLLALLGTPHEAFSAVGVLDDGPRITIATADGPRGVATASATATYFEVLGVRPYRGRLLSQQDVVGRTALLSHDAWLTYFGGGESIVGQSVTLGNTPLDVAGVLPPGLFLPAIFGAKPAVITLAPAPKSTGKGGVFYPVVRLAHGISVERAQAALDSLALAGLPEADTRDVLPVLDPPETVLFRAGRPIMQALMLASLVFLVLASVNLASLLLVRNRDRARDVAVRLALGASRTRIIRPLFFELITTSVAGAGSAVLVAKLVFPSLLKQVPGVAYGSAPVGIDLRVALITLGLGLVTTLVFSFLPTWHGVMRDAQPLVLTGAGSHSGRGWKLGRPLVAVQVALTVLLVFGATVTGRAFVDLLQTPLGFDPQQVARLSVGWAPGPNFQEQSMRLLTTISRLPDVSAAGAASQMPFDGSAPDDGLRGTGGARVGIRYVLPGFFEAARIPIVRGRTLTPEDAQSDPDAAVLSASAARVLFGDRDPLGGTFDNGRGRTFHVVGVSSDILQGIGDDSPAQALAIPGRDLRRLTLLVRLRTNRDSSLRSLEQAVKSASPTTRTTASWWTDGIFNVTDYRNPRFQTTVLSVLSAVALLLTAFGIVGVVGFLVASRTRELAIRAAIGATGSSLIAMVIRQGLAPVGVGLVIGLLATRWAARLAEAQLFKVDTTGFSAIIATAAVVLAAALVSTYLPSRRAGRLNPADVLRVD
ncbi:MAG: ABC transporter permease [Acidobacteriota bacterium]